MVTWLTPYDLLFPQMGFHMPPTYANGHISATGDPIHFMFSFMVGFSETADRTALLRFEQIQDGGHRHVGNISNGHISATATYIYSAHRAVVFAVAQLSCIRFYYVSV